MGELRIGQVSSVDRQKGMAKILYNDRDGAVTKMIPLFSFDGEYKPPKVGQYVLVGHLSNGTEAGCVMGTYWNETRPPTEPDVTWRKELGTENGEAYLKYDKGIYEIVAEVIQFVSDNGNSTVAQILERLTRLEERVSSLEERVSRLEGFH